MHDATTLLALAAAALAGLVIVSRAGLRAWHEWVELQRFALSGRAHSSEREPVPGPAGARIELADLRERVRKLEAIAAGVDL